MSSKAIKKSNTDETALIHLVPLVQAAKNGDLRTFDMALGALTSSLRSSFPCTSAALSKMQKTTVLRKAKLSPHPIDSDSHQNLVRVSTFCNPPEAPILNPRTEEELHQFIQERRSALKLSEIGEAPPSSLMLDGPPGVGKTMTVQWLASCLKLPLVEVDLATVISSYLGKTGRNLRSILDFARHSPCVLFLDEFDALAKRRDDRSDLGELKRIVNVLLKEIELWPPRGVLAAATNHPEILDAAIWRRFDTHITLDFPEVANREQIIERAIAPMVLNRELCQLAAMVTKGMSGSDLTRLVKKTKRKSILSNRSVEKTLFIELSSLIKANYLREQAAEIVQYAKENLNITNVRLGELIGKSETTVRKMLGGS